MKPFKLAKYHISPGVQTVLDWGMLYIYDEFQVLTNMERNVLYKAKKKCFSFFTNIKNRQTVSFGSITSKLFYKVSKMYCIKHYNKLGKK